MTVAENTKEYISKKVDLTVQKQTSAKYQPSTSQQQDINQGSKKSGFKNPTLAFWRFIAHFLNKNCQILPEKILSGKMINRRLFLLISLKNKCDYFHSVLQMQLSNKGLRPILVK